MIIRFVPPSEKELEDAFEYYADQLPGLEQRFMEDFEQAVELVRKLPNAWKKTGKRTRRIMLKRFPYFVLYIVKDNIIFITCIAHQHRDPDYYIDRMV